jgi:hypothetical protein
LWAGEEGEVMSIGVGTASHQWMWRVDMNREVTPRPGCPP